jgi:hypothetical protein
VDLEQLCRGPKRAGTLEISSISSDLDALTTCRDPQLPGDVKLIPAMLQSGELHGTIHIRTTDPAFPEFIVPVSASIR